MLLKNNFVQNVDSKKKYSFKEKKNGEQFKFYNLRIILKYEK